VFPPIKQEDDVNRTFIATAAATFLGGILIAAGTHSAVSAQGHEPPIGGIHWARGAHPAARPTKSPNLSYHGGPVMHDTFVEPIFWGVKWSDPNFAGDKISAMQSFFAGIGGSTYAGTNVEYTDGSGHVSSAVTFGAPHFDYSTSVTSANTTGPILAEVCATITNPVSNGYYPVYIDNPRGSARFCAWHSAGTCNGVTVQFAFFFDLDGDAGCDPADSSGLHSQGAAALANVSGHELSEALTDRHLDAWYDSNGSENADKCAWSFGTPLLTFANGSQWKIQGNWSNAAFNAGTGFANQSGQKACLDGGNYK
jgi:hypothetical protein